MPDAREPLVSEDRLSRAWETILARLPGAPLDLAAPDAYIQRAGSQTREGQKVSKDVAVFAIAEPNPRFIGTLQVSVVHMTLEGWEELSREVANSTLSQKVDPLTWCLFQATQGHLRVMSDIRAMSHVVQHRDPMGEIVQGSAPQNRLQH